MADGDEQVLSILSDEEDKPLNEGVQTSNADDGQDPTKNELLVKKSNDTNSNNDEQTKCDKGCLIVLIIFDLILLILLILVYTLVKEPVPSQPKTDRKALQHFCLPCDQVYMGSFEIKEDRFNVCPNQTEYNKTCCAEPKSDLRMFIQNMYMRVRYQRDRANGTIFRNEPRVPGLQSCVNYTFPVNRSQEWNFNENSQTFLVQIINMSRSSEENKDNFSLKLEGGAIKILRRSHYYMFSQVTFLVNEQSQNVTQYVFRSRNGTEELLLENTVYPCYFNNNNFSIPSFVGAMFLFEEGDVVSLHVSKFEKIDSEKSITVGMQCI